MRFSTASVVSFLFLAASVGASPVADGSSLEARATESNAATEASSAAEVKDIKADAQWHHRGRPWGYGGGYGGYGGDGGYGDYGGYGNGYNGYGYGGGSDSRFHDVEYKETDASSHSGYGGYGYNGYNDDDSYPGRWRKREEAVEANKDAGEKAASSDEANEADYWGRGRRRGWGGGRGWGWGGYGGGWGGWGGYGGGWGGYGGWGRHRHRHWY